MSGKTKVSIIIPCYNYAHFLEDAVGSVIDQTYSNWECMIIDDGSTDDTKTVAAELMKKNSRVQYYHQQNKGLSAARNFGLSIAKGDYIQFLDADDLIHPFKLQEQVEILDSDSAIDVSYTNYQTFIDDLSNLTGRYSHLSLGDNPLEDFLFKWERGLSIPIHAALFRRSILEKLKKPFVEELKAKEDWVMWVQLAANGAAFYFLDKDYCYYRGHSFSQTRDKNSMYSSYMKAVFIILTIAPSRYHEKFIASSLKHTESMYLNIISRATLFYDNGEDFNPVHSITQEIRIESNFSFNLAYDLSRTGNIDRLRFDPLEGYWIRAKLDEVICQTKTGETMELDISKISSNGTTLINGYKLFLTFDPMYILPLSGELSKIEISGEIHVLENQEIENILGEKKQSTKRLIQKKEKAISNLELALEEKEHVVEEVKKQLEEKEHVVEEVKKQLEEKEHVVEEVKKQLEEKELEIVNITKRIEELDNQLSLQAQKIENMNNEIIEIFNSNSWKITAPLRRISNGLK